MKKMKNNLKKRLKKKNLTKEDYEPEKLGEEELEAKVDMIRITRLWRARLIPKRYLDEVRRVLYPATNGTDHKDELAVVSYAQSSICLF
jgi:hypothetical protein